MSIAPLYTLFFYFALAIWNANLEAKTEPWKAKEGKVFFKSETEWETIEGGGGEIQGSFDPSSKKIQVEIQLLSLQTPNRLQTSHLQENYLETHLYPRANFIGQVIQQSENGEVEAKGSLTLHGITRENVSLKGKLVDRGNEKELVSYFSIQLSEYGIQVPQLLFLKVNQTIQVKVKILWSLGTT